MIYYALMIGEGDEGCDYTIGCNKNFKRLDATTITEARKEIEDILEDDNVDRFESIQILTVNNVYDFDIEEFKDIILKTEKQDSENAEYNQYLRLKRKFDK